MLCKWLSQFVKVNHWNSRVDGIKHINSPNHPVLSGVKVNRAIYLLSDPRLSALSLVRRSFAKRMVAKLNARHRTAREYNAMIDRVQGNMSLEELLQSESDPFGFKQHWKAWAEEDLCYPVMFIKLEDLFENWLTLVEFLGLPLEALAEIPEETVRLSRDALEKPVVREGLKKLYGDFFQLQRNLPATAVRAPSKL